MSKSTYGETKKKEIKIRKLPKDFYSVLLLAKHKCPCKDRKCKNEEELEIEEINNITRLRCKECNKEFRFIKSEDKDEYILVEKDIL